MTLPCTHCNTAESEMQFTRRPPEEAEEPESRT
uniref:Uncharacterized protein n=1 Tax=Anguilla anguilla TaxID=7936 RepID=A0A0E9RU55_ANGAN